MRYLFIVGHPAHVHLFRNPIRLLTDRGHESLVGAVDREVTTQLLKAYGIRHFVFGKSLPELISKGLDLLPKDLALLRRARAFRPDILVSTGSPYGAHVASILSKPHIVFGDTERASLITSLMAPFTDAICTPSSFQGDLGHKHVRYNGYKELAYLHPKYFEPNPTVVESVGLSPREPYILMRFSAWDASHDIGDRGFAFKGPGSVGAVIGELERYGRVVVLSDKGFTTDFQRYSLAVPPELMHDVLAFARLYFGEGATMASEAGVLGVPWIFVSTAGRGFLTEQQERYGLGYWEASSSPALEKAKTILAMPGWKATWMEKRGRLLRETIDVTDFIVDFLTRWPDSFAALKSGSSQTSVSPRTG